ncbi:hypothetical protein BG20_I2156, partial [Candidatus Nitrosarchaeum limnium BG20]
MSSKISSSRQSFTPGAGSVPSQPDGAKDKLRNVAI